VPSGNSRLGNDLQAVGETETGSERAPKHAISGAQPVTRDGPLTKSFKICQSFQLFFEVNSTRTESQLQTHQLDALGSNREEQAKRSSRFRTRSAWHSGMPQQVVNRNTLIVHPTPYGSWR
jgi:hypothetical protein